MTDNKTIKVVVGCNEHVVELVQNSQTACLTRIDMEKPGALHK